MTEENIIRIQCQPGPQETFLGSLATIAIYGGSAGSGKSYALLLEPLRHFDNSKFGGVIFRKNSTQIRNTGGLLDESKALYYQFGAELRESFLEWKFPSGASLKFAHLDLDNDIYKWQGSQLALLGFDELVHFTEAQFWYMLSRVRSMSGVPGYVRATCNPDADSWVRELIDWWIGPDGFPIKERSGVLRWFVRIDNTLHWADSAEKLKQIHGDHVLPMSLTFIAATIYDNKILLEKDPSYLANLNALDRVEKARLLSGNWNVKVSAGSLFQQQWFPMVDEIKPGWLRAVRFWDRAGSKPHEGYPDPDWSRGLLMYQYPDKKFLVADLRSTRDTPGNVETMIKQTANFDGPGVEIFSQTDPGSAGKKEAEVFIAMLQGFVVGTSPNSKDKVTRAKPVSAQAQGGNISVLRAPWNKEFFHELEAFPSKGVHDDIVDVLSGSFNELVLGGRSLADVL